MKLLTLGLSPSASCFLLKLEGTRVLLDCALEPGPFPADAVQLGVSPELPKPGDDASSASRGPDYTLDTPQFHAVADWAAVDCVLISNYHNLLALPYVTEYTTFRGKVYATDPTIQIGRQLMEELVKACEEPQSVNATGRPGPPAAKRQRTAEEPAEPAAVPSTRRAPYTMADVERCLARIRPLSFKEDVELSPALRATPVSSGFCIGGANWVLSTASDKIVYVSHSSSATSRHPEPLDIESLRGADVLIAPEVSSDSIPRPDPMLAELASVLGTTIREGGSLLVPCHPSGLILDLIETFHNYLKQIGLWDVPLYVVSPAADLALAYANISSEWLGKARQDRVLLAEDPFVHGDLARGGALHYTSDPATRPHPTIKPGTCGAGDGPPLGRIYREPCVVFAGPPSLRGGAALQFVRSWAHRPNCSVALIDPAWEAQACRAPFSRLALRAYWTPLDLRLSPQAPPARPPLESRSPPLNRTPAGGEPHPVRGAAPAGERLRPSSSLPLPALTRRSQALVPAGVAASVQAPDGCALATLAHLARRHVPLRVPPRNPARPAPAPPPAADAAAQPKFREARLDAKVRACGGAVRTVAVRAAGGAEAGRVVAPFSSLRGPSRRPGGPTARPPRPPRRPLLRRRLLPRLAAALREEGYEELEEVEAVAGTGRGAGAVGGELGARVVLLRL
eukprot:tig00020816_g14114.t1